jgi:hypothetical protein
MNCFLELTEFHCDSNLNSSIFYGSRKFVNSFKKLTLTNELYDNPGLIGLITEQKILKEFKYTASKFIKHKVNEFSGIGQALEKNADTILIIKQWKIYTVTVLSLRYFKI